MTSSLLHQNYPVAAHYIHNKKAENATCLQGLTWSVLLTTCQTLSKWSCFSVRLKLDFSISHEFTFLIFQGSAQLLLHKSKVIAPLLYWTFLYILITLLYLFLPPYINMSVYIYSVSNCSYSLSEHRFHKRRHDFCSIYSTHIRGLKDLAE